mgnify:CR=1 FL=1
MAIEKALSGREIAISTSDSQDMLELGLSEQHLKDAMTEIARNLLALGSNLNYGGDLRQYGFSELLFELVARYSLDFDDTETTTRITNYLAWPVHIRMTADVIKQNSKKVGEFAKLVYLDLDGNILSEKEKLKKLPHERTDAEWSRGLTAMRELVSKKTYARIVLGGQIEGFKGLMPGIAEEGLISLRSRQPLYLVGGFGGCTRLICKTLKLIEEPNYMPKSEWQKDFLDFNESNLNNGLLDEENRQLAMTPHVDQAIILILRGLLRLLNIKSNA